MKNVFIGNENSIQLLVDKNQGWHKWAPRKRISGNTTIRFVVETGETTMLVGYMTKAEAAKSSPSGVWKYNLNEASREKTKARRYIDRCEDEESNEDEILGVREALHKFKGSFIKQAHWGS